MDEGLKVTVTLSIYTCVKGHVYALPNFVASVFYDCPMCAKQRSDQLLHENDNLQLECDHRQRVIRSLRGALKRKKARK